ncbi:MAG: hypothetical protein KY460_16220 [Actinobacteria bacterium]|nr:hypothetical protein [Actinomycetota bacterium]
MRIWTVGGSDGGEDAQVGGLIRYLPEHRCFVATGDELEAGVSESDLYTPVLWPQGTRIVSTDPPQLEVPGVGIAQDGDVVFGGGAHGTPPEEIDVPDGCFGAEMGGSVHYMQRAGE